MSRTLLIFDDAAARTWHPFSLTRPVGELLFGTALLRERIERATGLEAVGYLATPGLEGFEEDGAPPSLSADAVRAAGVRVLLSSRYVPSSASGPGRLQLPDSFDDLPAGGLRLVLPGGAPVGWLLGGSDPLPDPTVLLDPSTEAGASGSGARGEAMELPGRQIESPWQLLTENAGQIAKDLGGADLGARSQAAGRSGPGALEITAFGGAAGVHVLGNHPITVEAGVTIDPLVVLDAGEGPIHLGAGVHIHPLTHLRGPAFVGRESVLMGGVFGSMSCGPVCKLRGEVQDSILLGYSNKAHDGYLGHSILGRWANLGAFTTNSDLKNNYGAIRVAREQGSTDTGLMKLGVLLGDHVKTGIGTLLGAGTVVGAGSNLFGGGTVAGWIPAFSWGSQGRYQPYHLDAFLETAERAMGRRKVSLTPAQRRFLGAAWRSAHPSESPGENPGKSRGEELGKSRGEELGKSRGEELGKSRGKELGKSPGESPGGASGRAR